MQRNQKRAMGLLALAAVGARVMPKLMRRMRERRELNGGRRNVDLVNESSRESFPASDSPSFNPGIT